MRVTTRHPMVHVDGSHPEGVRKVDTLAVEEPLEIRLDGAAYTVTMRTPGHDIELVHGLLAAEGIIRGPEDVREARYCAGAVADDESGHAVNTYNVLEVLLAPGVGVPTERLRSTVTSSACGVCGTASIDLLRQQQRFDLRADTTTVDREILLALPDRLRAAQRTFDKTGGLHGVALFDADGRLLVAREDVGRHNATDKVLGWALLQGRLPASGCVLMVSGRTSFELAQKAVLAGVPVLAGVSAPSSLAVQLADEAGLTLAGFVRGDRMNIYSHPDRVALG
ncbi:formate dehydrogenase accessory sulfurtransferase FdhD [Actinomycetota bacterium]